MRPVAAAALPVERPGFAARYPESFPDRTGRLRRQYDAAANFQALAAVVETERVAKAQRAAAEHASPQIADQLRRAAAANEVAAEIIRRTLP